MDHKESLWVYWQYEFAREIVGQQYSCGKFLWQSRAGALQWRHYQNRHQAQQDILQYIAVFYINQRLHLYLEIFAKSSKSFASM